jgi:hypothetical protein
MLEVAAHMRCQNWDQTSLCYNEIGEQTGIDEVLGKSELWLPFNYSHKFR